MFIVGMLVGALVTLGLMVMAAVMLLIFVLMACENSQKTPAWVDNASPSTEKVAHDGH